MISHVLNTDDEIHVMLYSASGMIYHVQSSESNLADRPNKIWT